MGFSPGEFLDGDKQFHWEGGPNYIYLWNHNETVELLRLDKTQARKALSDLQILVEMLEADAL